MGRYIWQRVASLLPVLLGISLMAFMLGVISPGDPAEIALNQGGISEARPELIAAMREKMGLNDPLPVQYLHWLTKALSGDLGISYATGEPVGEELVRRLPVTLTLAGYAMLLTCIGAVLMGTLSAAYRERLLDHCLKVLTNIMLSFPAFWLGLVLVLLCAEFLGWLPTSGTGGIKHMLMPAITLSCATTAMAARLTRSALLAELGKQYYLAASARGLGRYRLIVRNALPNAIFPVITLLGNYFGGILGGSAVIETIFALPGIGSYAIGAISMRDYPALQGYVLFTGFLFVTVTLVVDLMSRFLNPKIRLGGDNL